MFTGPNKFLKLRYYPDWSVYPWGGVAQAWSQAVLLWRSSTSSGSATLSLIKYFVQVHFLVW